VYAGVNGVYYRKTLSGLGEKKTKTAEAPERTPSPVPISTTESPTYLTPDGVLMRRIISANAESMQNETRADALASLNEASQTSGLTIPTIAVGGGLTILVIWAVGNPGIGVLVAFVTAAIAMLAARRDLSKRNVVFAYQLDDSSKKAYRNLTDAFDSLARSQGLWYVDAAGEINNLTAWKRNAGASELVNKHKTAVGFEPPPCVQSNVIPPGIRVGDKSLYFFPDCILVRQANRYGSVAYDDLRLATRPQRFIVEDRVPTDSMVVGRTWKHPNKKGGPDRRFANNRELPICLFEELGMISGQGMKALLMASARDSIAEVESALLAMRDTTKEAKVQDQVLLTYE
jgi:predicted outer membrane protein